MARGTDCERMTCWLAGAGVFHSSSNILVAIFVGMLRNQGFVGKWNLGNSPRNRRLRFDSCKVTLSSITLLHNNYILEIDPKLSWEVDGSERAQSFS